MLASIPAWKLHEWQIFYELEPDGDERNEWGLAHIVQAIAQSDKPLSKFILPFGDSGVTSPPVQQTVEYQEMVIDAWVLGSNAIMKQD